QRVERVPSTSDRPCTEPVHYGSFEPKRKAKLGPGSNRDNTMKNGRNSDQSRFPHRKYSPGDNVDEVDWWGQVGPSSPFAVVAVLPIQGIAPLPVGPGFLHV